MTWGHLKLQVRYGEYKIWPLGNGGGVVILTFKKLEMTKYFNHVCDPDPNYIYSCFLCHGASNGIYVISSGDAPPSPKL